jgi:hypothetical protein
LVWQEQEQIGELFMVASPTVTDPIYGTVLPDLLKQLVQHYLLTEQLVWLIRSTILHLVQRKHSNSFVF